MSMLFANRKAEKEEQRLFTCLLTDVLKDAENEKRLILDGKASRWSKEQIQNVVIPEMSELLDYAGKGEIHFKYGRKQRLLESSYLITDSANSLTDTVLGKNILKLQKLYDSF